MDSQIRSLVKCCKHGARQIIWKQAKNGACEKDFSTKEKIGFTMGIDLSTHQVSFNHGRFKDLQHQNQFKQRIKVTSIGNLLVSSSLPLTIEIFSYLCKEANDFLHNCANVVWSLKRPSGAALFCYLFSPKVSIKHF